MILSMREQGLIFAFICLLGLGFGFLYDLLRIFSMTFGVSKPLSIAEDFIYWAFAAFAVFYFLLGVNYGEVRLYMVLGFMGGMIFYYLTLSPPVMKISCFAINAVKKRILRILRPFLLSENIVKLQLKKTGKWVIINMSVVLKKLLAFRRRLKRKEQRKKAETKRIKRKKDF